MGFAIYWSGTTVSSTVSRIQDCAPAAILLLLGWGTNNVLYPPKFLAVVFKKQEILQQVLFHIIYI